MKWQGRQRSTNVEDRRGASGRAGGGLGRGGFSPFGRGGGIRLPTGRRGGGLGSLIGVVVVLGIIWVATGTNPIDMLTSPAGGPVSTSSQSRPLPEAGADELADFVGVVVKETEDLWTREFSSRGMGDYPEPNVVLFTGSTESGCGIAQSATGPFYCPPDQKVYLDLGFYDQLRRQFGAPGDFAQAYVLAHEVGHHIQQLTGVLEEFNAARSRLSRIEENQWSIKVELQADCYAGVWANYAGQQNLLETGDVEEAVNAAIQVGDDAIQERTQGYAVPKTFNHGTSAQRKEWFTRGFESGDVALCDTFAAGAV